MSKQFTYTLKMDAEIGDLVSKVEQAKSSMAGLVKTGKFPGIEKSFNSIEKALGKIQETAKTPIISAATFGNLQKDVAAVQIQLQGLEKIIANVMALPDVDKMKFLPPELEKTVSGITTALSTFSAALEAAEQKTADLLTAEKNLAEAQKKLLGAQNKQAEAQQKVNDEQGRIKAKKEEIEVIKEQIKILKEYQAIQKLYEETGAPKNKKITDESGTTYSLPKAKNEAKKITTNLGLDLDAGADAAIAELTSQLETQEKALTSCEAAERRYQTTLNGATSSVTAKQAQVNKLTASLDELNAEFEKNKAQKVQVTFNALRKQAEALGVSLEDIPIEYTKEAFEKLEQRMQQASSGSFQAFNDEINQAETNLGQLGDAADSAGDKFAIAADEFQEGNEKFKNTTAILERIKDFVGLKGGIEIARAAMRNAISTIKELDSVMTEMAVVTDLSVGDYWKQLPEHTTQANELGVAISEVYKAETLYYQQGLKTNEVTAMSAETLKMARIAGLSAEDATNKMTAALRGFNMELNETSAQKVADVYSELAAITASDVDEISSAMTKTASIASSAGMEFETTAAFLSQIIETTRESAETAGTAMKTVIARFQELKKDPSEIGEVDGEIVDANAIETALRSVGVSLRDASGQFRDLDTVFLELASKWDSLDTNTQRYIATIAAGSRQQSRFIAMMSDYGRTQELVTAANNSAGASNEQFEKTLESLESKLAKLKNAWDSFTMGLMDSEILKAGVELLTNFITAINNLTNALGPFDGAAKIGLLVAALYLGDKALHVFMASLKNGSTVFQAFGATGRAAIDSITGRFNTITKSLANMKKTLMENQKNIKAFGKVKVQVDTKSATKAMSDFTKATNNQTAAQKMRETVSKNSAINEQARSTRLAALDKIELQNEQRKTAAVAQYAAVQQMTTAQASVALGLQAMGIGQDVAEAAARGGLTAAKMADYQASMIAAGMDEKEIALRMGQIAGLYAEAGAENTSTKAKKGGIAALWSKITAGAAHVISLVAQTIAQWAYNAAVYAGCPPTLAFAIAIFAVVAAFAAIIAVIGLVIAGIVAFVKAMKANSPEGKLKSAEEAAKAAADAADKAKEAYEGLAEAFDSLDDKYKSLEELTKGTKEWKEAIREINTEVMALINRYPELAKFVTNTDGVLTIDLESEEVQKVLQQYETADVKAQAASLAAKMNVNEKQSEVDKKGLSEAATVQNEAALGWQRFGGVALGTFATVFGAPVLGGVASGMIMNDADEKERQGKEVTDQMAKALADGLANIDEYGNIVAVKGSEDKLAELGLTTEQVETFGNAIADGAEELRKYGQALRQREEEEKAYYQSIANSVLGTIDATQYSKEQQKQMANAATSEMAERLTKKAEESFDSLTDIDKSKAKEAVAKSLYGTDATISGNTIKYKDEEGKEVEKELQEEEFKKQWAAMEATEEMRIALEAVPSRINKTVIALENLSAGLGAAYKRLVADPNKITKGDAKRLQTEVDTVNLNSIWSTLTEAERKYFGDFQTFVEEQRKPLKEFETAITDIEAKLSKATGQTIILADSFSVEGAEGYADVLSTIATTTGQSTTAMSEFQEHVAAMGAALPEEELNFLMNAIGDMDETNLKDWEQLKIMLEETGHEAILTSTAFKNFEAKTKELVNAINKVNISKLVEGFRDFQKIIGDILSGEQGREIEEELYNKLINSNTKLSKDIIQTNEGYLYIGDSMADLAIAINEATELERQKAGDHLNNVEYAQTVAEAIGKEEVRYEVGNLDGLNAQNQRRYISSMVESYRANEKDISELKIKGLSNETTLKSLLGISDADVKKIFNDLKTLLDTDVKGERNKLSKTAESTMFNYEMGHNIGVLQNIGTENTEELMMRTGVILSQAIQAGVSDSNIKDYNKARSIITAAQEKGRALTETELKNIIAASDTLWDASIAAEKLSEETETWVSEIDFLEQATRRIEESQRERNRLEREYEKMTKDNNASVEQMYDNIVNQMAQMNVELDKNKAIWKEGAVALAGMTDKKGVNAEFAQYVNYDAASGTIAIDWKGANAAFGDDQEKGELFDKYVADLYEIENAINDAKDGINDVEDDLDKLVEQGEKDYSTLWNQIRDVMLKNKQDQIDKLDEVNSTLKDAQSDLLSKIQEQIEDQRQAREDEKAQQELNDKESRLAYLRRDTTGANDLTILDLEEEIEDTKEGMLDRKVDQALNNLQKSNEQAAIQRQRQIDIAQAQLDLYAASQTSWTDAQTVLEYGLGHNGDLGQGLATLGIDLASLLGPDGTVSSDLNTLLGDTGLNKIEQEALSHQISTQIANAQAYRDILDAENNIPTKLGEIYTSLDTDIGAVETQVGSAVTEATNMNGTDGFKENEMFKSYQEDLETLASKVRKEEEEKNKKVQQDTAYENLLNDSKYVDRTHFERLKTEKKISDDKTYESYTEEHTQRHPNSHKPEEEPKKEEPPKVQVTPPSTPTQTKTEDASKFKVGDKIKASEAVGWIAMAFNENGEENWLQADFAAVLDGKKIDKVKKINDTYFYRVVVNKTSGATRWYKESQLQRYKTGGLADFTGPAWLDGTKARPEMVLNARDTQNFIQLKDILSDIMSGTNSISKTDTSKTNNVNTFDIDINVESINDDYDVEQLADKIREMLYDDSMYRNVNTINLTR